VLLLWPKKITYVYLICMNKVVKIILTFLGDILYLLLFWCYFASLRGCQISSHRTSHILLLESRKFVSTCVQEHEAGLVAPPSMYSTSWCYCLITSFLLFPLPNFRCNCFLSYISAMVLILIHYVRFCRLSLELAFPALTNSSL
jgi:hypothetical protein